MSSASGENAWQALRLSRRFSSVYRTPAVISTEGPTGHDISPNTATASMDWSFSLTVL